MLKLESELKEMLSKFTNATGIKLPESALKEAVRIYGRSGPRRRNGSCA